MKTSRTHAHPQHSSPPPEAFSLEEEDSLLKETEQDKGHITSPAQPGVLAQVLGTTIPSVNGPVSGNAPPAATHTPTRRSEQQRVDSGHDRAVEQTTAPLEQHRDQHQQHQHQHSQPTNLTDVREGLSVNAEAIAAAEEVLRQLLSRCVAVS